MLSNSKWIDKLGQLVLAMTLENKRIATYYHWLFGNLAKADFNNSMLHFMAWPPGRAFGNSTLASLNYVTCFDILPDF